MRRFALLLLLFGMPGFAAEVAGTWTANGLTLTLQPKGAGGYEGTATVDGLPWPAMAQDNGDTVTGVAQVAGEWVPFVASRSGEGLQLRTADGTWMLARVGAAPKATAVTTPASTIIAQGSAAVLTRDAALAFHEALLFSLTYAGVKDAAGQVGQQAVLDALPAAFGQLSPDDQVALANARAIWSQTRAAWPTMSEGQRREFAVAVLELAFGEQATARAGAPASGRASGSGSMPGVDINYPGSDCWASAGCVDYDSGSGTYTYEEPMPSMDMSYE